MKIFRVTFAVCLILPLFSCGKKVEEKKIAQEITTATVTRGTIERTVPFTGSIVAKNAVDIFPHAAGKVSRKLLKEGDTVKRNQPIFLVERDEVGYTFKPMPVVSPIDGLVSRLDVDVGTNVSPNMPVAAVIQPGDVRVKLDVPERYLDAIHPDTEVIMLVDYLPDEIFKGKIITLSPALNIKSRTANVEIEIPNAEGKLRHGMFGRINIAVQKKDNALIVPSSSISWEGSRQFIYKVKDGKVFREEAKVGIRNETHVELLEGANEGDILADGNLLNLK